MCADFGPQLDYERLAADTALLAAVAPRFGAWQFWDTVGACVGWPAAAATRRIACRSALTPTC